jgi:hypothetical protein
MKDWKDITLRQAQEILNLGEMDDELDLIMYQMAIIRDTTIDVIEKLKPNEIVEFAKEYQFLNKIPQKKLHRTFKHAGKRFGIIDFNDITLAQMVDIEEYYADNFNQNMHKILSCLYLETTSYNLLTGKYKLKEYEPSKEREDMFLDMNMEFVWENILFFYHIGQIYLKGMKDYLNKQIAMEEMNQKN